MSIAEEQSEALIPLDDVTEAVADIAAGRPVVVVDDTDRENEGDIIFAADAATPELLAFIIRYTSGVVCVPMLGEDLDRLDLPLMTSVNEESMRTAYTVTVDARSGVSTGISAADRAHTIRLLADARTVPGDFVRPGHILPLRYRPGGVLVRRGHTEAAVDLARLAGLRPAGVLAEVVNDDGTMARLPRLREFADEHGLRLISVEQLAELRADERAEASVPVRGASVAAAVERSEEVSASGGAELRADERAEASVPVRGARVAAAVERSEEADSSRADTLVDRVVETRIPNRYGEWRAVGYRSPSDGAEHVALVYGDLGDGTDVLTRLHSECLTGDAFGSHRCDCGTQLDAAMAGIAEEGRGVLVYLRGHEGRGIGLLHKLKAYRLQDSGIDTVDANLELGLPADAREFGAGARILADLGVRSVRLLSNNPGKVEGISRYGVSVTRRISMPTVVTADNLRYLQTKRDRMGHDLPGLFAEPRRAAAQADPVWPGAAGGRPPSSGEAAVN
ncbi:3,4-dihydroxy 2-butanone 4-phosphate synthase/GTP cyclohydrolase II [Spinactinospora alkalitolerans]|uniref:Multifunctional fusion protein n=1 Tax=Spinactinospora alkalitolerans TaxID=687207 RepID=A0A852TXI5_9ACTN|nr:GTP cyclohydrolase II [Spinactinospora alkalitolerans]NYE48658.1 3,4-dihydroxy 2-butanone 4-phosphate synthase/GTP cyclohydrolase II [Spinactinospora alkalitolerans]